MATSRLFIYSFLLWAARAQTDFSVTTSGISSWDQGDWSLTATKYIPGQYQSRMSLSNGYIGASLAAAGPFFEIDINQTDADGQQPTNGWPLFNPRISFSTISGFYDVQPNGTGTNYPWLNQYGWESFISGIPHPTSLIFAFGDSVLDATVRNTTISNFASKLSFKTGVGQWSYTWTPGSSCNATFNVEFAAFTSRVRPNVVAVKACITPSADVSGTITDLLDGRSAVRSQLASAGLDASRHTIYSSVHPDGLIDTTAWIVSGVDFSNPYTDLCSRTAACGAYVSNNDTTIGQTFGVELKGGQSATFYKYVGAASTDKFADAESVARYAQQLAQEEGWNALLEEHVAAWGEIMTDERADNFTDPATGHLPNNTNIEALQIASVANTYYLLQSLQLDGSGLNYDSIAVGGLTSDSYAGLIFWDADYWMAPGLNLAFPEWSKQISNFRVKQHSQALANAAFNGYPKDSALYSWTAGRYGNCTGTGPCADYEYHLNYDIAFNLFQLYNITQNLSWLNDGPRQVIESAAVMTSELLQYNDTTQTYWLHNMTDPDEYANNKDNGAFTIASAAQLLQQANDLRLAQGLPVNQSWLHQSENIQFPMAPSNITLEYQTMNNSVEVKQADVVLLTYPLGYDDKYTTAQKLVDLEYYANKQSPNGPAMTYSVFAINANTLAPSGCSAYTYTLNGILPYLRAPFYQFSEQADDDPVTNSGTNPAFPFLTGHGGANQIVPFGFLGLRTDQQVLYLNPSLPPQIGYVRVRMFHWAGATLVASINSTHTNLTRIPTPDGKGLNDTSATRPLSVTLGSTNPPSNFSLAINATLQLPNRVYSSVQTQSGNLLQCQPITSGNAYLPGQFPEAAIDGATSTRWQPVENSSASIVVDLSAVAIRPIRELSFEWGTRPPLSATVTLWNDTGREAAGREIRLDNIVPDQGPEEAEEVRSVVGNVTTFNVADEGIWSARFARLIVYGCWVHDGRGATVGEWNLVAA